MSYNLYDYNIKLSYNKDDSDFIAKIDEIIGCSAFGSTPEAALKELETAFQLWLETTLDNNYPIPAPTEKPNIKTGNTAN
jgi:predicted RNase H-like HicB family nuclease